MWQQQRVPKPLCQTLIAYKNDTLEGMLRAWEGGKGSMILSSVGRRIILKARDL
jgi:hypothetical protein